VDPRSIDLVLLTHAHIDHSGYLPRLVRDGFRGPVYATRATVSLLKILLPDSGHLQEEETRYANKKGYSKHHPALPLYTAEEGLKAAERVAGVGYETRLALNAGLAVTFHRAGHILGSAILSLWLADGRRLIFSGDLGRYGAPILPDPTPIDSADALIIESTYGDRFHGDEPAPEQLARAINEAVERGGAIIIPAFAVGRTQELMYHLSGLERAKRIPRLPTYVDSPMAIDATEIYCDHPEEFDGEMRRMTKEKRCPLHSGEFHLARTRAESMALNRLSGPFIVISASGMATGGRVLHHLKLRLPDPRTTVLLVGYQAAGTRGRLIQDGAKAVKIHGEEVPVRANVETIHGLSAHADRGEILRWLSGFTRRPARTFVVHGEPGASEKLRSEIAERFGWDVTVPSDGQQIEI
jgi:metallo-beta-lactamase family protein